MSPRPDIEGYYDQLNGDDRKVLELKPRLTCEASIRYRDEECFSEKPRESSVI
ncbi:hypothetical protein [Chryseobacterium sp. S90]|uniref:hypothetical protein n=1 Tax=Chryseobacterium sp. S90 TaxID=3395373 RepID=UPI0039BD1B6A